MGALLSLIPGRVWLYGLLAAVLIGFGIHYKHLESKVHDTAIVAQAAIAAVKIDNATAQSTETQSAIIYKQAILIPTVGDLGVSCVRQHAGGGALPPAGAGSGATAGGPATDGAVGPPYDPSGAALTRARAADAQIAYLQRRVKELETQMNNAP